VAVSGKYAFVAAMDSGLVVVDVSDPMNPTFAARYGTVPDYRWGGTREVKISGDYAFLADSEELFVLDISDPTNPTLAWRFYQPIESMRGFSDIAVSGDYVYSMSCYGTDFKVIQVFDHNWDLERNVAQSLAIFQTDDEISGIKLTPSHPDSINWFVSADSGTTWDPVRADGEWYGLSSLGGDLLWRAELRTREQSITSSCSSINLEWKYSFAEINNVQDVPEDEGGWARVGFDQSGLDIAEVPEGGGSAIINNYGVHRRVDDVGFIERILEEGTPVDDETPISVCSGESVMSLPSSLAGSRAYALDGRHFYVSNLPVTNGFPEGVWEVVATVPGAQQPTYLSLVPTREDSLAPEDYTVYVISSHTTDPDVYYFGPPDSGYSVDNLAPEPPQELTGDYVQAEAELLLTWNRSTKRDFSHFSVYKGSTEDFAPDEGNLIGVPWDTVLVDDEFDPSVENYYKVSAWDIHRNESDWSLLGPEDIGGVGSPPAAPLVTRLEQNVPNPFNPVTMIRFSVAEPGWVRLVVFDVAGRPVRTLVQEHRVTNRYEAIWDGLDDAGRAVASGVYLYQLEAPGYLESKKMVLLK
jgi:hypothetical protein